MARVILLGSANSIPDDDHENTHFIVIGMERTILVDCVSNPVLRLRRAQVDPLKLSDLLLTHFHPDHVSGVPLLLMDMWLMGRTLPLNIYGLKETLDRTQKMMDLYQWETWPDFFPVNFHSIPDQEKVEVIDSDEFRILSSPVRHLIPTLGLRIEFKDQKKVLAYSCDTEPCIEVVELSRGADVLIHEASGATIGHSSAKQAGEIALKAGVGKLFLIHYPVGESMNGQLIDEAKTHFHGQVALAKDFQEMIFD